MRSNDPIAKRHSRLCCRREQHKGVSALKRLAQNLTGQICLARLASLGECGRVIAAVVALVGRHRSAVSGFRSGLHHRTRHFSGTHAGNALEGNPEADQADNHKTTQAHAPLSPIPPGNVRFASQVSRQPMPITRAPPRAAAICSRSESWRSTLCHHLGVTVG